MTSFPVIKGSVITGNQKGRTIGFPTANLDVEQTVLPLELGVYFGTCQLNDQSYFCLPYYGPRIVLGETKNCFEVYIYDFNQEIYGQILTVQPLVFLRKPAPFTSFEDLRLQLEKDKAAGRQLIKQN